MKSCYLFAGLLLLSGVAVAQTEAEVGLAEIQDLGRINGQALACSQMSAAGQAKAMMLRHAPKTRRYGEIYEEATNAAFLAQGKDAAGCPSEVEFSGRLYALSSRLQRALPAVR